MTYKEPWIQGNGQYTLRIIVSEVLSLVGNWLNFWGTELALNSCELNVSYLMRRNMILETWNMLKLYTTQRTVIHLVWSSMDLHVTAWMKKVFIIRSRALRIRTHWIHKSSTKNFALKPQVLNCWTKRDYWIWKVHNINSSSVKNISKSCRNVYDLDPDPFFQGGSKPRSGSVSASKQNGV